MKPALKLLVGDKEFRAIGHVAAQWAFLENHIDSAIFVLAHQPATKHLEIKPALSFTRRMKNLRHMAKEALKNAPEALSELLEIAQEASSLRSVRDDIIHGEWRFVKADGGKTVRGIHIYSSVRDVKYRSIPFSAENAEEIAAKISYATYKLIIWSQRYIRDE